MVRQDLDGTNRNLEITDYTVAFARRTRFGRISGHRGGVPTLGGWKGNFDPPFRNVKGCRASRIDVSPFPGKQLRDVRIRTALFLLAHEIIRPIRRDGTNSTKSIDHSGEPENVDASARSRTRISFE